MKKELVTFLAVLLFLVLPGNVLAQDFQNQPGDNQNNPGVTSDTRDEDRGFNWWWLLPLALLPLIPLFFRREDKEERVTHKGEYEQAAYHDIEHNKKDREQQ